MTYLPLNRAMEILELTDIEGLTSPELDSAIRQAKKKWHPDKVAPTGDTKIIQSYTANFQLIEPASQALRAFLEGKYHSGDRITHEQTTAQREPFEVIRENAAEMQQKLKGLWMSVRRQKYKYTEEEVLLSEGIKLRELIDHDYRDNVAINALYSFQAFNSTFGIVIILLNILGSSLGFWGILIWELYALFCLLAFLPLSRFWLPTFLKKIMLGVIDFGITTYNGMRSGCAWSMWFTISFFIVDFLNKAIKYLVIFPLYEIGKLIVGDKIVGVVKDKVDYYGGSPDWYIEELLAKNPKEMTEEELYNFSDIYTQLADAPLISDNPSSIEHP